MAENSFISWTDHTQNFWVGCTKVSAACDHCYAEKWAIRAGHPELWQGKRRQTKTWGDPLKWEKQADKFFIQHKRRQRVFTNSLADFLDNEVPDPWRVDSWAVVDICQNLDWLIVTKRISNFLKMTPSNWSKERYSHVILIITVVTQDEANRDIPRLVELKERWPWLRIGLSCEPLLEKITLRDYWLQMLDWVIIGGESGGAARPMNADWARHLRDQCAEFNVPFHFKQWGEWITLLEIDTRIIQHRGERIGAKIDGIRYGQNAIHKFPGGALGVRVGINRTGRLLDGVLHDGFPKAA